MTTTTINRSGIETGSTLRFVPDFLGKIGGVVANYVTRSRAERQLADLDDRLLLDIGLSRSDIHAMVWGRDQRR
ncbi:MAG: DUF1127 domain-containing protein [Pseudomonadota bacterium]|nr:DUF1127 domain-containing protein [Pseudomonadota bacterium]